MSDEGESESDDRMGRADRIRNTREGRRDSSRRSRSGDSESSAPDESTSEEQTAQTSQRSQRPQNSQTSQKEQRNEQDTQKQPVKQRPHRTIYLPDDLDDEFESVIDRLQYETKSEEGVKLAKNRHTYPLIVYLGLERASDMTPDEVLTSLTETDILDTPES
ncbi:hypothetical protein [Halococcus thailandensis]|uniref:DUF8160 domain-containing protein n=1 Tax=Halococcus thailandensis JCM 13552 TaxID=1227457 RepID=M0NH93_9EURY|nr:hypothetical protein [Halococcus thailandensis]EMA56479.1 hypothetical protein C451_02103 [Halococcus thailandensis JCM 13552]